MDSRDVDSITWAVSAYQIISFQAISLFSARFFLYSSMQSLHPFSPPKKTQVREASFLASIGRKYWPSDAWFLSHFCYVDSLRPAIAASWTFSEAPYHPGGALLIAALATASAHRQHGNTHQLSFNGCALLNMYK